MSSQSRRHHAEPAAPTLSLLRASAASRLAGVAVVAAAIWAGVIWAWS
jgi:hypothetical protein